MTLGQSLEKHGAEIEAVQDGTKIDKESLLKSVADELVRTKDKVHYESEKNLLTQLNRHAA